MTIQERIVELLEKKTDDKAQSLWRVCKEIVDNIIQHNKLIISQMSNYDIHDQEHSEKVLEIIENVIGKKIEELSFYELILIYMSAYLHDSAMAMPKWEYDLLKAVEGTEDYYDNTLEFRICNDYKPVHKFSEALLIIQKNKQKLFDYQTAKNYVCVRETEEEIISSLAELMCSYEEFRNGYIDDLNKCKTSVPEYINMSKMIRSEFIRQTHHTRSADNIFALKKKISGVIGDIYSNNFVEDLADICRCHGEDLECIFELQTQRKDWKGENSNIQFIAILLRLGDVIHFDSGRAPLSLFAEKQITDETSFKHWNAKFQELSFEFYCDNNNIKIKYMAYCKEPEIYYFIQDYLDWVDNEIDNYYILKNKWGANRITDFEKYNLPLGGQVDRSEVKYDKDNFIPNKDMKFVLHQAKILELLMGVQLYKDKYLCIREIYQNALDASKCMLAFNKKNGKSENLNIEFGIGTEMIQGKEQKYIYCLDHGTGMNSYIINNYLLHIGNSYYKSKDFAKKNTDWGYDVKPTSQFGIGILSGYMLADKIGITTVYYEGSSPTLSFILEGASEHFYYIKPSRIDEEQIGTHGTLVKLYLKSQYEENINVKYMDKLPIALMTSDSKIVKKICDEKLLKGNLFYILSKHIGISHVDIPVLIKDERNFKRNIFYSNTIFDQRNYEEIEDKDVEMLWSEYYYFDGSLNPYKKVIEKREFIDDYVIKVVSENLEIYSHIALPRKGIGDYELKIFDFCHFLGKRENSIFVDGILVSKSIGITDEITEILGDDILRNSILNYFGSKRPILSVDRNSCVKMPDMEEELNTIRELFINELKNIIMQHIAKEKIAIYDAELTMIMDIAVRTFPSLSGILLKVLGSSEIKELKFDDIFIKENEYSLKEIFSKDAIELKNVDFTQYQEVTRQVLLGRIMNADTIAVDDLVVDIKGGEYEEFPYARRMHNYDRLSLCSMVIKADTWNGIYKEYDLVNILWPIVNPHLFNHLIDDYEIEDITNRSKAISDVGNGLQGIAALDPVMIHPFYGISSKTLDRFSKKECYVGEFDNIQKQYWLFELTNQGKMTREQNVEPVLFAYIAPRQLNLKEQERLAEFAGTEPEYVKGIKEGWSILFFGAIQEYVICSGVVDRKTIVQQVPDSYRGMKPEIKYVFTDGSKVFE
ncbi:MAG: hypothetical protein IJX86_10940 [Lachnospiraceae bacterium]|nr:hypothetical protein [Lachnospiraceae bacterium]